MGLVLSCTSQIQLQFTIDKYKYTVTIPRVPSLSHLLESGMYRKSPKTHMLHLCMFKSRWQLNSVFLKGCSRCEWRWDERGGGSTFFERPRDIFQFTFKRRSTQGGSYGEKGFLLLRIVKNLELCIYIYLLCCICDVQDKTRQGTRHCLDIRWSFSVVTTASLSLTESLSIICRTSTPGYFHSDIQSANISFFLTASCWRWNSN